jgi:hypothetical protein
MKTRFLTLLLTRTSLLLFSTAGFSGVADIAITLKHQPLDDLQLGQVIPFSITISNHGPDTAGADSTRKKPVIANIIINESIPIIIAQDFSIPQTCDFLISIGEPLPPNTLDFLYSFYYPPIPAGESLTCYGLVQVFIKSGGESIEWYISSPPDNDPIDINNTATMVFGIKPPMVHTLSFFFFIVLAILMMKLTFYFMKENK